MSTLTQFLGGKPRRHVVTLTASNASLPIPSWAQGGKGIVYVTGCGGGGSGQISITASARGAGGGSGAFADRHPFVIPSGSTTCNAQIGAGATAVSGTAAANGNGGGETSLSIGSQVLRLEGGRGGGTTAAGSRGLAYMGAQIPSGAVVTVGQAFGGVATAGFTEGINGVSSLKNGSGGGNGSSAGGGWGMGGQSPFGAGGAALNAAPGAGVNVPGADASGYGAGGAGARYDSGGAVSSGAGSPGLLILEFVEGA